MLRPKTSCIQFIRLHTYKGDLKERASQKKQKKGFSAYLFSVHVLAVCHYGHQGAVRHQSTEFNVGKVLCQKLHC